MVEHILLEGSNLGQFTSYITRSGGERMAQIIRGCESDRRAGNQGKLFGRFIAWAPICLNNGVVLPVASSNARPFTPLDPTGAYTSRSLRQGARLPIATHVFRQSGAITSIFHKALRFAPKCNSSEI